MTDQSDSRIYPPDDVRRDMRRHLLNELTDRPAKLTASEVVDQVRRNGGAAYSKRALTLELSRMLGGSVRMNPNRTLTAKH